MALPPIPGQLNSSQGRSKQAALIGLRLLLALGLSIGISHIKLDYLESFFYDLRVKTKATSPNAKKVALVLFGSQSAESLKSDLSATILSKTLLKIEEQKPRFIVVNLRLKDITGTDLEKKTLSDMAAKIPGLYLTSNDLLLKGDKKTLSMPYPWDTFPIASAPQTSDSKILARDNVTRRMLISYQDIPLLHTIVAGTFNPTINNLNNIHGSFKFAGSDQVYVDFDPPGSFPRFSFQDILNSKVKTDFKDKIVIIGNDTDLVSSDYVQTPYSRELANMTTAEMHANMFDTLLLNSAPQKMPDWFNTLLTFIIAVFTVHIVLSLKPSEGLILLGEVLLGFIGICYLSFWLFGLWIPMATPILAVFLCYYFLIPYRLIIENRRSWEYYQKNKLLSQVEELKTNFISMMSHDLKTPIARIQGMTNVILTDNVALSSQQREAVDTIKHSSDDLLKFINAILNYGRIESQGVQLHLQTKDINNVLHEVIKKHEFLAKVKRIQIVSELDPLFPIPMDADLMRQVLSNLVENAIKYSPEDTKIMVTSEERDDHVVIQVADQGPGIPQDELNNIFMKFFRSKNVKSSQIKGSGLGLYLAKYFTELHKGRIFVESNDGKGSTFTVELPMEQGGSHA